jgi:hypothetical protein
MIKGKHFDHGFEPTRNGHDAAGAAEYRLSIPHVGVANFFLGIVLTPTSKMICVAQEFD